MDNNERTGVSNVLSAIVLAAGACILAGWIFDIQWLKSLLIAFRPSKANSGLCFMLAGAALLLVNASRGRSRGIRALGRALALAVIALSAMILFEYIFGVNLGIDQLLAKDTLVAGVAIPGRMALATALDFFLVGTALFLVSVQCCSCFLAQGLALLSAAVALLSFISFIYLAEPVLVGGHFISAMAFQTSGLFLLLSSAVLFSRPREGFMRSVTSTALGGKISRWLLPVGMLIPFFLGWLKLLLQNAGVFTNEFGVAFVSTANICACFIYIYSLSVVLNMTDAKRQEVERGLKEQAEQVSRIKLQKHAILDNIPDIAWLKDKDSVFVAVNEPFAIACGVDLATIPGKTDLDLWPKDLAEKYRVDDMEVQNTGKRKITEEEFQGADGRRLWIETIKTPIYNDAGQFIGTTGIAHDITVRKEMENSERLVLLGRLVADIAHEVNNPLMIISGNAQLVLMEDKADEETRHAMNTIVQEGQRAKSIIQRLLSFSRPSKGEYKLIDINALLDMVLALVEHQFMLNNVRIIRAYAENLPCVNMDEQQIQEVFLNLLTNAQDAMSGGGSIELRTGMENNRVRVTVSDTGIGMNEKVLQQIFQPFFTTKDKGTGLGLSICARIVRSHKGEIKVESTPGKGAAFSVFLPAA